MQKIIIVICFALSIAACRKPNEPAAAGQPIPAADQPVAQIKLSADTLVVPFDTEAVLDGTGSYDPRNLTISFSWKKISGPDPLSQQGTSASKATYVLQKEGMYGFELTVRNTRGLEARDTALLVVVNASSQNTPRGSVDVRMDFLSESPDMHEFGKIMLAGSKIFITAGITVAPNDPNPYNILPSRYVYSYDLETGTWKKDSLSNERNPDAVTGNEALAVFAGGYQKSYAVSNRIDILDQQTMTWSYLELPSLPENMGLTLLGDKIIIAGGGDNFYPPTDAVLIYDMRQKTWTNSRLSEARSNVSVINDGKKAYFAGGDQVTGYSRKIDIYDGASGAWTSSMLAESKALICGLNLGTHIVWAGGGSPYLRSRRMDFYDPAGNLTEKDYLGADYMNSSFAPLSATLDNRIACFTNYEKKISLYEYDTKKWRDGVLAKALDGLFAYNGYLYGVTHTKQGSDTRYQVYRLVF